MGSEDTLSDIVGRVVDDAKAVAQAELTVAKERGKAEVRLRVRKFGIVGAFLSIAILLATGALVALLVGLILTLAPITGPGWATLIVTTAALLLAALLAWLAVAEYRRVRR